jgi:putative Holliday junction resolvase
VIIVALDVGAKRIGVATGDDEARIATPREVISRRTNAAAIAAIMRVLERTSAGRVVVGLPVSFDGRLHAQARSVQAFAEQLSAQIAIPLVYQDETLSTVRAEDALRAAGVRPERIRERIDAAAAAIILQEYLDQHPPANPPATGHGGMSAHDGSEETEEVRRV